MRCVTQSSQPGSCESKRLKLVHGPTPTTTESESLAAPDPYPGLVQMVSVLALNKLELKDMITAEMVENPVLEELEESVPMIDEVGRKEEDRDRPTLEEATAPAEEKKDAFEEIDFGRFFRSILTPAIAATRDGRHRAAIV